MTKFFLAWRWSSPELLKLFYYATLFWTNTSPRPHYLHVNADAPKFFFGGAQNIKMSNIKGRVQCFSIKDAEAPNFCESATIKKVQLHLPSFLKNWNQTEQLFYRQLYLQKNDLEKFVYLLLNHIGCVMSRYLKNVTNNIFDMFYLRTSSLRHKIIQDNFGSARVRSGSNWESSRFRIIVFNAGCKWKCFLLNPEKKLAYIRLVVFEKKKTHTL